MGFDSNHELAWPQLEKLLSSWDAPHPVAGGHGMSSEPFGAARGHALLGSDAPVYKPPPSEEVVHWRPGRVPYAELHCHSNFSFLDGASAPDELAREAARAGLEALAITDHDGMYGVVRFAEAAKEIGIRTVFGAELSLDLPKPQNGEPDPVGQHLLVLARDPEGYGRICRAIGEAQLAGKEKGKPEYDIARLAELHGGHWLVLTGCRKGPVPKALAAGGAEAALLELHRMIDVFGKDNLAIELWDHGFPTDSARNDALFDLASGAKIQVVASNNVHYASPARWQLANALAAVRARRSLDEIEGWLPPAPTARIRSGEEMAALFARYPGAVQRAAEIGLECAFDLALVAPQLPDFPVPKGHSEMSWLRYLTYEGAAKRYGPPERERVAGAYKQIDYELDMIEQLGFPGYFLIVWDIVQFCKRSDILCQGRGSAANSAVCYALGITNADAVSLKLLFERFLSPERDGPPDIDLDIESDRREEAIQYVYNRHGRQHAAQVANVICYRPRSAVRDMAKALGHSPGQQDAWSKQIDGWGQLGAPPPTSPGKRMPTAVLTDGSPSARLEHDIPQPVMDLAHELQNYPRHLGIHSGGMVICDRPVLEVCPVEWGRMENRTVLQWDKEDCAAAGLVKFDLLGLGMLSAIHYCIDLIKEHHRVDVDLATLPQDPAVYAMLCKADTVGVFQVESRAQMATLPRLKPRTFYDIVVEVALIRPGPIQGGSVHPYIRRRNGREEVTYLHPLLEASLAKTLGVPLFQEQLMQMAVDAAGFTAAEADQLRQAMGSKRSAERMERLRARLYDGMAERGITGEVADAIYAKLLAFANFGFPESHSVSFAYLVYASSWLKYYYPAAFLAALLNAQPMGFWAPRTLVMDARRHGVFVKGPDINASAATATLEGSGGPVAPGDRGLVSSAGSRRAEGTGGREEGRAIGRRAEEAGGREEGRADERELPDGSDPATVKKMTEEGPVVRLGIEYVRTIGKDLAKAIDEGRPYRDMEDLARRQKLTAPQLEALATAGAFGCFGLSRREALWAAGVYAGAREDQLVTVASGAKAPDLPEMEPVERASADLWSTGLSPDTSPMQFIRPFLHNRGILTAADLETARHQSTVTVAGVVTHRQKPATAKGTIFVSLEDETGLVNVICVKGVWDRYRKVARSAKALVVTGRLERVDGVINLSARKFENLSLSLGDHLKARDFR